MPLVHNGIMYLVNPGNIVQALDATTGDLIWENQIGPEQPGRHAARCATCAIYEDKVSSSRPPTRGSSRSTRATAARSGRRRSPIARTSYADDRAARSSRKGKVIQGLAGLRPLRHRSLLHQRLRRGHRQAAAGSSTPSPQAASRAATRGASCRRLPRRAARPGSPAATIRI